MNRYNEVKGAFGIGKVKILYKQKKKYRSYGIYVIALFLLILCFSYCYSKPKLRYLICVPILRYSLKIVDLFRQSKIQGIITLHGPKYNVTIHRNSNNGIPLIEGNDTYDVIFAQGYLHANDRLYQMDMARRIAMGTYSELMGDYYIKVDILSKSLNISELAENDVKNLSPEDLESLEAYSNGINSYHFFNPDIPFEFSLLYGQYDDIKEWNPIHTMAIYRMYIFGLMHGWEDEFVESYVVDVFGNDFMSNLPNIDVFKEFSSVYPSVGGSAWLINGSKTISKKPLIACNLKSVLDTSKGWYMNSLISPTFSISGASIPGIPYIMLGHNNKITWLLLGLNEKSESMMVIDEKNYCTDDKTCNSDDITYENHTILVRNDTTEIKTKVNIVVERYKGQPIINSIMDKQLLSKIGKKNKKIYTLVESLSKTSLNFEFFRNVVNLNNFDSLRKLSSTFHAPVNILYTDNDNNIGYVKAGSSKMSDALFNPSSGYIIFDDEVLQNKHSYIISKLLKAVEKGVGVTDIIQLQSNVYSPSSMILKDIIMDMNAEDNGVIEAQNIVKKFGGHYLEDAAAPLLIEMFRIKLRNAIIHLKRIEPFSHAFSGGQVIPISKPKKIFKDDLLWLTNFLNNEDDNDIFKSYGNRDRFIHKALIEALDECKEIFGNHKTWKWGILHSTFIPFAKEIRQILNLMFSYGPNSTPGGLDTYFRSSYNLDNYGISTAYETLFTSKGTISSLRMIIDTYDFNALFSIPMSNHRRTGSRWFQNNLGKIITAWANNQYELLCSTVMCIDNATTLTITPSINGRKFNNNDNK